MSTFDSKTLSIDTSKYNKFEIVTKAYYSSNNAYHNICICRKGIFNTIYNAIDINVYRSVEITDSGFVFGAGFYQTGIGTKGTSPEYAIPIRIYGIKC